MTTKHKRNEYFPWEPDKQNHTVKPKKIALSRIIELGYTGLIFLFTSLLNRKQADSLQFQSF